MKCFHPPVQGWWCSRTNSIKTSGCQNKTCSNGSVFNNQHILRLGENIAWENNPSGAQNPGFIRALFCGTISDEIGEMPEWLNGPVSKTGVLGSGTVGSNPTLSASPDGLSQIDRPFIFSYDILKVRELVRVGDLPKRPIICYGAYWQDMLTAFSHSPHLAPDAWNILDFVTTSQAAIDILQERLKA